MSTTKLIILGSSRNDGDANMLVKQLKAYSNWDLIDLNNYTFSYFDYQHSNKNDDFLLLIKKMIKNYDTFIFATPVYWFAMSGIMKVFFDRFTDLLTVEKELGRKLRKKNMAAISCSVGNHLGNAFWLPFSETAKYLGMQYLESLHTITGKIDKKELISFIKKINIATQKKLK